MATFRRLLPPGSESVGAATASRAGLFVHLRNYLSAGVLTALVGVLSFPILTRALSVEQYGILGLVTATLTLYVAFGKLGLQHAVIRYFAQINEGNSEFTNRQMVSTVLLTFVVLAVLTTLLWILSGFLLLPRWMSYDGIGELFMVAAALLFLRLFGSSVLNFLRAEQRSGRVAVAMSMARVGNLALIIVSVLLFDLDPATALICMALGELLCVAYALWSWRDHLDISMREFRSRLLLDMIRYGLPLMMLESLGLVLRLSDRYMIEAMLGVVPLGQYSASYNLTGYLDLIILAAIAQALRPAYMQLWESGGTEAVSGFLASGLRLYLLLSIPFVTLFSLVSPHMLAIFAGDKFYPGTVIIPFVAASFLLEGAMHWLAAGLYIQKDTTTLMKWGFIATLVNVSLNLFVIPRFGISGAAMVTVLSYLIFMLGVGRAAFRHVRFPIAPGVPLALAAACTVLWYLVAGIDLSSHWQALFVKGLVATPVLLMALLVAEPSLWTRGRELLRSRLARTRSEGA